MKKYLDLIDLNFKTYPLEEKRAVFMILDIEMKHLHEKGFCVTSFNPKNIHFQNGIFVFEKIERVSQLNFGTIENARLNNIRGLSNFAFCSYLPDYDLKNGLLSPSVVSGAYDKFKAQFNPIDNDYYRSVLVDSYNNNTLPPIPYYYDYISNYEKKSGKKGNSSSLAYVKATEAGRFYANQGEQGFGKTFFLLTIVASLLVLLVGFIVYFMNVV